MNNKGFSLIELLVGIFLISFVFFLGLTVSRKALSTSLSGISEVSDSEVYEAAKAYTYEKSIPFNDNNYTCITVKELIDSGYLREPNDTNIKNKIVKLTRNKTFKTITNIKYVNKCK